MQLLSQYEGLGRRATIETENVAVNTLVTITGNATVDPAGAGDVVVGRVSVAGKKDTEDTPCTVELYYKELVEGKFVGGAIAAGVHVKTGAPSSGATTFAAWDDEADLPTLIVGIVWVGAAENGTGQVLTK